MAQNRYSEVTRENGQLEIHLGFSQAALYAAEEEASAVRAWLAESDTAVVGKTNFRNASILISTVFILIVLLFSMIVSPDSAPDGGERGRRCH